MKRHVFKVIALVILAMLVVAPLAFSEQEWLPGYGDKNGRLGKNDQSWRVVWVNSAVFEGVTSDQFEALLKAVDPTANNILLLPNISGILITNSGGEDMLNATLVDAILNGTTAVEGSIDMQDNPLTDVGYIMFNTTDGIPCEEGKMFWNDTDGTNNLGLKGSIVCLQMGQEMLVRGKNTTGASLANGTAVRISGGTGSFPEFGLANAAAPATAGSIGITTEIIGNNQFGYVTVFGLVRELDTTGTPFSESWNVADRIYVGNTDGELTNVAPTGSERKIFMGIALRISANEGIIWVNPINQAYFNELSGPLLTSGSIVFINSTGMTVEDNANLFWDDTNDNLGVGVGTPDSNFVNAVEAQVFVLNSPRWDDLRMPAVTGKPGAAIPDFVTGAVSNAVGTYCFDKNTDEELYFATQVPHAFKESTDIELHLHWFPVDTGIGNVAWITETEWENIDATFGSTLIVNAVPDAADGTQYKHQMHDMADLTGTTKTISSGLFVHVYRDANESDTPAGSDTYDDDACLMEIDFHYQTNTPGGSAEEDSK